MQNWKGIKLFNSCSILNKMDVLSANVRVLYPGIIRITESWMNETINDAEVFMEGYDFFRCDRPVKVRGGGVFTRDSIYAIARICYGNSVCLSVRPSVCLSHGWISQKRLKLGSRNFHHTVAPSL